MLPNPTPVDALPDRPSHRTTPKDADMARDRERCNGRTWESWTSPALDHPECGVTIASQFRASDRGESEVEHEGIASVIGQGEAEGVNARITAALLLPARTRPGKKVSHAKQKRRARTRQRIQKLIRAAGIPLTRCGEYERCGPVAEARVIPADLKILLGNVARRTR